MEPRAPRGAAGLDRRRSPSRSAHGRRHASVHHDAVHGPRDAGPGHEGHGVRRAALRRHRALRRRPARLMDEDAFRSEVVAFLEATLPRKGSTMTADAGPGRARAIAFQGALAEAHLAGITWPTEY